MHKDRTRTTYSSIRTNTLVSRTKTRTITKLQGKDQFITLLDKIRDFSVNIDGELSMDQHVRIVVRSSFYQLKATSKCNSGCSLVATRVDYCNAVLRRINHSHTVHTPSAVCRWCLTPPPFWLLVTWQVPASLTISLRSFVMYVLYWLPVLQRLL